MAPSVMKEIPSNQLEIPALRSSSVNFFGQKAVAIAVANGGTIPPAITAAIKFPCPVAVKAPVAKT